MGIRRAIHLVLIALLSAAALLLPRAEPHAAQGRVVVASGEYVPYSGQDLPHGGFVNHVVTEAFKLVGVEVEFHYYPWARAFDAAKTGKANAVSYVYVSERRTKHYYLSDRITSERLVLFSKKGTNLPPNWKSLADLKDYKFGLTRGFTYTDELWELVEDGTLQAEETANDTFNFAKLLRKRIDILPADEIVGYTILRHDFAPGMADIVVSSETALAEHVGVLGFTKSDAGQRLRDRFNIGLKKLIESGKFQEMSDKLLRGEYIN